MPGEPLAVSPNTIVFVPDSDNALSTYETFPPGVQVRFRVTPALRATNGRELGTQVLASTTVGTDLLGRDYLTRLFHGARISLLIGFAAMLISGVIGTTLGVLAGSLCADLAMAWLDPRIRLSRGKARA